MSVHSAHVNLKVFNEKYVPNKLLLSVTFFFLQNPRRAGVIDIRLFLPAFEFNLLQYVVLVGEYEVKPTC